MYIPTDNLKEFKERNPNYHNGIIESPEIVFSEIASLQQNWNHNGASSFSKTLIEKCEKLVKTFPVKPNIFPTASDSIQFEWNHNGNYLEFNVFENGKCEGFIMKNNGNHREFEVSETQMLEIVKDFFSKTS